MSEEYEDIKLADFPNAAAIHAATENLKTKRTTVIKHVFRDITCPKSTDNTLPRAQAYVLFLDTIVADDMLFMLSLPPYGHEKHIDFVTYGSGTNQKDRIGQFLTEATSFTKNLFQVWGCEVSGSSFGSSDLIGLVKAFELEIRFSHINAMQAYTALLNTSTNIFKSVTDEISSDNYERVNDFIKRMIFAERMRKLSVMRPSEAGKFPHKDIKCDWETFTTNLTYPDFVVEDAKLHGALLQAKSQTAIVQTFNQWMTGQQSIKRESSSNDANPFGGGQASTFSARKVSTSDKYRILAKPNPSDLITNQAGQIIHKASNKVITKWQTVVNEHGKWIIKGLNGKTILCETCRLKGDTDHDNTANHNRNDKKHCRNFDHEYASQWTHVGRGRGGRGRGGRSGRGRGGGYGGRGQKRPNTEHSTLCYRDGYEGGCRNYQNGHCNFHHEKSKRNPPQQRQQQQQTASTNAVLTQFGETLTNINNTLQELNK